MTKKTDIRRIRDKIQILHDDCKMFGYATGDIERIQQLNKELKELEVIE